MAAPPVIAIKNVNSSTNQEILPLQQTRDGLYWEPICSTRVFHDALSNEPVRRWSCHLLSGSRSVLWKIDRHLGTLQTCLYKWNRTFQFYDFITPTNITLVVVSPLAASVGVSGNQSWRSTHRACGKLLVWLDSYLVILVTFSGNQSTESSHTRRTCGKLVVWLD